MRLLATVYPRRLGQVRGLSAFQFDLADSRMTSKVLCQVPARDDGFSALTPSEECRNEELGAIPRGREEAIYIPLGKHRVFSARCVLHRGDFLWRSSLVSHYLRL